MIDLGVRGKPSARPLIPRRTGLYQRSNPGEVRIRRTANGRYVYRRFTTLALATIMLLTVGQATLGIGRFGATDLMSVPTSGTLADGAFGLGQFSSGTSMLGIDLGLAYDLELGVTAWVATVGPRPPCAASFDLLSERSDGFGLAVGVEDVG